MTSDDFTQHDAEASDGEDKQTAWIQLLGLVVLLAAGALVFSGIRTSQAEVMASTSSAGLFSAGTVELDQAGQAVQLLFDQEGLFPGSQVDACVEIIYRGTIDADVRFHGRSDGGTGLDDYMQFTAWVTDRPCPDSGDLPAGVADDEPVFDDTLSELWRTHGSYDDGISLARLDVGEQITLAARAELQNDQNAAGLYADFVLSVEGRP